MIKRWILHVEFHWGYWPRISFRRVPKPGDRVLNGDEMGTLKLCPECQDGLLHEPDWRAQQKLRPYTGSWHATAPAMDLNAKLVDPDASPETLQLDITLSPTAWQTGMELMTHRAEYIVTALGDTPTGRSMILTRKDVFKAQQSLDPDNYYEQKRDW